MNDVDLKLLSYPAKDLNEIIVNLRNHTLCLCFLFFIFFGSLALVFFCAFSWIYGSIILSIVIIIILFILYFSSNKIKFVKNLTEDKLYINVINFFCCVKEKYTICCLENIHFDYVKIKKLDGEGNTYYYSRFYVVNDFKNPLEIDLDKSKIQYIPAKFFYVFNNVVGEEILQNTLNNFINAPLIYDNPLFYDIKKEMYNNIININNNENNSKVNLNNYMKLSNYFFTYYLAKPSIEFNFCCCFFLVLYMFFLLILSFMIRGFLYKEDSYFYIFVICLNLLLNLLIILLIFYCKNHGVVRIDFIYSTDYQRIFIGSVKKNEKSYENNYIINMNKIKEFILESKNYSLKNFILKVQFKNGVTKDIYHFNGKYKDELDGLLYLLNRRFNNNNNYQDNEINTYTPK